MGNFIFCAVVKLYFSSKLDDIHFKGIIDIL